VGLERGALSLVIEELLERKTSVSGLETREYGRRDPSSLSRGTLYQQTLALTSPTSCCRSIGIVRPRTQTTEFLFLFISPLQKINKNAFRRLLEPAIQLQPTWISKDSLFQDLLILFSTCTTGVEQGRRSGGGVVVNSNIWRNNSTIYKNIKGSKYRLSLRCDEELASSSHIWPTLPPSNDMFICWG
jgi:hypothetical protein